MKDPPYDKKTAPGGNQGAAKTNQTRPDNTARPGDGKRVFDPATLDAMRHRLHEYLTARGVELTRRGARLVARCPMHDDSSPSFAVYGSKLENCGCHPCAFSGDVFAASQWMGRASNFPEAVRDVADTLGVYLPDSTAGTVTRPATPPQRAAKQPEPPFILSAADRAKVDAARLEWCDAFHSGNPIVDRIAESLGIDRETLRLASWGQSGLVLANGWLAYAYPQGMKWRNPNTKAKPRFVWIVGKPTTPWRAELIKPEVQTVYLTEGESDCLALIAAGLEADDTAACVASPGKDFSPAWAELFTGKRVVLCFDIDPPEKPIGQAAAVKVAAMLAGTAAAVLNWKGGTLQGATKQDCRSILQAHGPEVLRALAQDAEPFEPEAMPQDADDGPPADEQDRQADAECGPQPQPERKPLSAFVVNHAETLGMSWEQIDNLRPPYVIDQFVRQGEVMLLGAESKSRKSWLAQDAGFCVASGLHWLADEHGQNGFATAQAKVHVIDLELNPAEMRYRFAKARGNRFADSPARQAQVTAAFHCYSFDGLNVVDILPRLAEVQPTVQPGDLVNVDCLYRLAPDGNEVAPLAAILETVKRFAAETQAAVIVVDHFRKAGDDKARNRFAGSFIKQASASTLVAIETKPDDMLELNIDARTFHGVPRVHARFNLETYTFDRVPDAEIADAKAGKERAEAEGWLVAIWKSRVLDYPATAQDGVEKWGISRQGATDRFKKLAISGTVSQADTRKGAASQWILTPKGAEILRISLNLHP